MKSLKVLALVSAVTASVSSFAAKDYKCQVGDEYTVSVLSVGEETKVNVTDKGGVIVYDKEADRTGPEVFFVSALSDKIENRDSELVFLDDMADSSVSYAYVSVELDNGELVNQKVTKCQVI